MSATCADQPSAELLAMQAEWLAPARARLLRRAGIARMTAVLDLGAGQGAVTAELRRRSNGYVVSLDRYWHSLKNAASLGAFPLAADARNLPFGHDHFDLVYCQCTLLWIRPLNQVVAQIRRVLKPGGMCITLEPDYGGLIEHPPELKTAHLWEAALTRAGADPIVGRRLPSHFRAAGFSVTTQLLEKLTPPSATRFEFLRGLPLTSDEAVALAEVEAQSKLLPESDQVAHLPFFLITAVRE